MNLEKAVGTTDFTESTDIEILPKVQPFTHRVNEPKANFVRNFFYP